MAAIPYFILSPTGILALISLLKGPDKTIPSSNDTWKDTKLEVIIPVRNEAQNVVLSLASLENQTFNIHKITLIDDNSSDDTVLFATEYLKNSSLKNVEIIRREEQLGKTASLYEGALSSADAILILDGDTMLFSENYIERLVEELYKNAGVASASGRIYPFHEDDFQKLQETHPALPPFLKEYPKANYLTQMSWLRRFGKGITNMYRDVLYLYLESFIYKGETTFCGSIPNTIGCAAVYRVDRLKDVFDKYMPSLGFNFTDAEDTFIGFAFIDSGFRNTLVPDVFARTQEPEIQKLPRQQFIWSSGFLQTCYYFKQIVTTPFKHFRKGRNNTGSAAELEKRKIHEEYRQSWGVEHTKKYGRPIGWYILTTGLEKFTFPLFIAIMLYFQNWEAIYFTLVAETVLISLIVASVSKPGRGFINFGKTLLITPLRYCLLLFELVVVTKFLKDVIMGTKESWRI